MISFCVSKNSTVNLKNILDVIIEDILNIAILDEKVLKRLKYQRN